MAVTKPVCWTNLLDIEVAVNSPCQEDLIKKMYQNMNMLNELAVIGSVEAIAINQVGVPTPEPTIHQLCDGSEITEPTSPLRTQAPTTRNTPDIRNRYIRGANGSTTSGNELGGASTVNLSHNHGGVTGSACFGIVGEEGDEQDCTPACHTHSISSDLSSTETLDPAHLEVTFYLKIN